MNVDEMVLRPGLGVEERQTRPDTMPWLDRRRRGRVRAWFEMIGKAMTAPGQLIASTPPDSASSTAWSYGIITASIFFLVQIVWLWSYQAAQLMWGRSLSGTGLSIIESLILIVGGAVACAMVWLLAWSLLAHGILRLFGRLKFGFNRTVQAICYSAGAGVFALVPWCGLWVGVLWWGVSAIVMISVAHQISRRRAAIAAAWPPLFLGVGPVMLIAAPLLTMAWAARNPVTTTPWGSGASDASLLQTRLVTQAYSHLLAQTNWQQQMRRASTGQPTHPLELLIAGPSPWAFTQSKSACPVCDPSSRTTASDIPVGAGTLASVLAASRADQLATLSIEMKRMTSGVVTLRLGDFIFIDNGGAFGMDANLWSVVMLPDPNTNPVPSANAPVYIGTVGHALRQTTYSSLPAHVQQQNVYRATLGLPPLPDLATVTHSNPTGTAAKPPRADSKQ